MTETEPRNPWRMHWVPDQAPPEGQRAAFHRLAAAIRRMNELLLDSDMPEEDLLAAAERAERFADQLAEGPRNRPHWGFAETSNSGDPRAFFDSSPLIGLANPVAPPLYVHMEDGEAVAHGVFGLQYEGPPGHVHGGFVAASFDEVLGMAQSATGSPGMTGTLTVRYRQPTPLHREIELRARVDRVEGKKIFVSATLRAGETLCAEAEGIFVSVDFGRFHRLAGEAR